MKITTGPGAATAAVSSLLGATNTWVGPQSFSQQIGANAGIVAQFMRTGWTAQTTAFTLANTSHTFQQLTGTFTVTLASSGANEFFYFLSNVGTGVITLTPQAGSTYQGPTILNPGDGVVLTGQATTWVAAGNYAVNPTFTASAITSVPLTVNGLSGQTGNLQAWSVNGTAVATIAATGTGTFPSLSINANLQIGATTNGVFATLTSGVYHLRSTQTTAPAIAAGAGATSVAFLTPGTDIRGTIVITGNGTVAAGTSLCTVTFNQGYTVIPTIIASVNGQSVSTDFIPIRVGGTGPLGFQILLSQAATFTTGDTVNVGYMVVQ